MSRRPCNQCYFFRPKKLLVVRFNEETLHITYLISRKVRSIPYSDVISLVCNDSRRGYHIVVIEFKYNEFENPKKIKVDRFVDADKLVPFLKWLKITEGVNID